MNYELKKLAEWFKSNKLSLNSGKLQKKQKKTKKELDKTTIIIDKSKLSPVPNANYCALVLDEFFSWDAHVKNCVKN